MVQVYMQVSMFISEKKESLTVHEVTCTKPLFLLKGSVIHDTTFKGVHVGTIFEAFLRPL